MRLCKVHTRFLFYSFPVRKFRSRDHDFFPDVLIFETFRSVVFTGDLAFDAAGAASLLRGRPGLRLTGAAAGSGADAVFLGRPGFFFSAGAAAFITVGGAEGVVFFGRPGLRLTGSADFSAGVGF